LIKSCSEGRVEHTVSIPEYLVMKTYIAHA